MALRVITTGRDKIAKVIAQWIFSILFIMQIKLTVDEKDSWPIIVDINKILSNHSSQRNNEGKMCNATVWTGNVPGHVTPRYGSQPHVATRSRVNATRQTTNICS